MHTPTNHGKPSPSELNERKRFVDANLTKAELVQLCGPNLARSLATKKELVGRVLEANSWDELLSSIVNMDKLSWWQVLFLKCLSDGPKTKKEVLESTLVGSVLSKVKAEGFGSDLANFQDRKLRLLMKYGYVSRERSGRAWRYAVSSQIAVRTRILLLELTAEAILERFHSSPEYEFMRKYTLRRLASRPLGREYYQPVHDSVDAKPAAYVDESAKVRRIVAFSDYRIQDIELLLDFVGTLKPKPDLLLYGGDDVSRFGPYPDDLLAKELEDTPCGPWSIGRTESGAYVFNLGVRFKDPDSARDALTDAVAESLRKEKEIQEVVLSRIRAGTGRGWINPAVKALTKAGFSVNVREFSSGMSLALLEVRGPRFRWRVTANIGPDGKASCHVRSAWSDIVRNGLGDQPMDRSIVESFLRSKCLVILEDSNGSSKKALLYNPTQSKNFFEELARKSSYGLCAVIGNDDYDSVSQLIRGSDVYNVHESPVLLGEYAVIGMEGSPTSPDEPGIGACLYTEEEIKRHLESFQEYVRGKKLIIISHAPPRGVLDHAVRFGRRDIGSQALKKFVVDNPSVEFVVCGHVHRCGGLTSKLGDALVVNAASHDNYGEAGRVAVVDIGPAGQTSVEWHLVHELSGIFGVGEKTLEKLHSANIRRVEDLLRIEVEKISEAVGVPASILKRFVIQAKAIVEGRPLVLSTFERPKGEMAYLDIETNLDQSLVWLIGVYSESRKLLKSFFAKSGRDEKKILSEFLQFMAPEPDTSIGFYACTGFDKRVLGLRLVAHGLPAEVCDRMVDLCLPLRKAVAFPLKSYGIKSLSRYFGYEYRHPDLDGFGVALLYSNEYQEKHDQVLEQRLLEYNQDDVMFLKHLTEKVSALTEAKI